MISVAFLAGLLLGGGLIWLSAKAHVTKAKSNLEIRNAVLQETLEQERKQAREKSAIEIFWGPFLSGDPPLVIYSNTRFLGDSRTGMRYVPAGQSPNAEQVVDHYTGIGELASVYELTRLFDSYQASFVLKRSLLVTWDEAKVRNLVFIGSPAENLSLRDIPGTQEFVFQRVAAGSRKPRWS